MNDDLEALLARMPLRQPGRTLDAKVMALRPRRRLWTWVFGAGAAAAAAAVMLAVALPQLRNDRTDSKGSPTAAATSPAAEPVRVEQRWTQLSYEGMEAPDDRTPMLRFRRQVLRHVKWLDEARGEQVEMTIPREDVVWVKASVY